MVDLGTARAKAGLTQRQLASRLGVTQAYLSMLERGVREPSPDLSRRLARALALSPVTLPLQATGMLGNAALARELAGLGYPGLSYLRARPSLNPAVLLLGALESPDLEGRLVEALPWVPFHYPDLDWDWLVTNVKLRDLQNRLGFVVQLASELATSRGCAKTSAKLKAVTERLSRSKLVREDTLSEGSMTETERRWLREHRSPAAAEWNLLSELTSEQLQHVE